MHSYIFFSVINTVSMKNCRDAPCIIITIQLAYCLLKSSRKLLHSGTKDLTVIIIICYNAITWFCYKDGMAINWCIIIIMQCWQLFPKILCLGLHKPIAMFHKQTLKFIFWSVKALYSLVGDAFVILMVCTYYYVISWDSIEVR